MLIFSATWCRVLKKAPDIFMGRNKHYDCLRKVRRPIGSRIVSSLKFLELLWKREKATLPNLLCAYFNATSKDNLSRTLRVQDLMRDIKTIQKLNVMFI